MTTQPPAGGPAKAMIWRLDTPKSGTAEKPPASKTVGSPIPVQFNPTSLKLDRNNDTSTGATTLAQRRHKSNEGHATLSLELIFDTAEVEEKDEAKQGQPVDVRGLTADLRQFVEPDQKRPKEPPPRMRFVWGKFSFDGIVSRIGEELDYFAHDGTALRAKVSLSITGQDEKFEANTVGPGSRDDRASTPAGGSAPNTAPGAPPTRNPTQTAAAQAGESVQQVLSRLGGDPATWRSAMAGLDTPLGLTAGAEVRLNASIAAGAGIGVSAGFSAGADAGGVAAAAGLGIAAGGAAGISADGVASASISASASAEASAGFAFAAQGGVAVSAGLAQAQAASAAVAGARIGFDVPGNGTTIGVAGTAEVQADTGVISRTAAAAATARLDPRAVSYGRGVPLRPRPSPAGPITQA